MPQTFVVLQCAFCHAYQVTLDKASKKFNCAICSQKQSFRTVHAISNSAKDCRKVVQELNTLRGAIAQHLGSEDTTAQAQAAVDADIRTASAGSSAARAVEWDSFAETDRTEVFDFDEGENGQFVTALPEGAAARSSKKRKVPHGADQDQQPEGKQLQDYRTWSNHSSGSNRVYGKQKHAGNNRPRMQLRQQQQWLPDRHAGVSGPPPASMQPATAVQINSSSSANATLPRLTSSSWHKQNTSSNYRQPQQQQQQQPRHMHPPAHAAPNVLSNTQQNVSQAQQQFTHHQLAAKPPGNTSWVEQGHSSAKSSTHQAPLEPQQQQQQQQRQPYQQQQQQPQSYQQQQQQRPPLRPPATKQLPQKKPQAAAAGAWGAFIDDDDAGACSTDDDEADVDEQGLCCFAGPQAGHQGLTAPTSIPAGAAARWGS